MTGPIASEGAVATLASIVDDVRPARVLLVTGGASFERSGAARPVRKALEGAQVRHVAGILANPTLEQLEGTLAAARQHRPQLVVAVGGGSVLDVAKMARVFLAHPFGPRDYLAGGRSFTEQGPPLVAVPTTSGSGSEATQFAVLYVGRVKHSVDHPSLLPDHALLDPALTASLSPGLTAATGIDALAQAIESFWSVRATPESRDFSRRALRLAWPSLPQAVHRPTREARAAMMEAANLAGRAINVTRTTAPHALSYALTMGYGVPHGQAVGVTLGEFFPFNAAVDRDSVATGLEAEAVRRSVAELCETLGVSGPQAARDAWYALMDEIHLASRLSAFGVPASAIESLAGAANPERLGNHPRRLTKADVAAILRARS